MRNPGERLLSGSGLQASVLALAVVGSLAGWAAVADELPSFATLADPDMQLIETAPGVSVEVLDWRGEGGAMLLLAGIGTTAHIYENFVHQFTDILHVYGMTRRGFGASTQPDYGYDTETLASDILAVMDSLSIAEAILVGHSLAGDEMTALAVKHPERVTALVYLDAAMDRTDWADFSATLTYPRPVPYQASDFASLDRVNAYLLRSRGWRVPVAEILATWRFSEDGKPLGPVTPEPIQELVRSKVKVPEFDRIGMPVLAFFALPTARGMFPAYRSFDEANRQVADQFISILTPRVLGQIHHFRESVPHAEVVEMPGANHYLFITEEIEVVRHMRRFLAGLK